MARLTAALLAAATLLLAGPALPGPVPLALGHAELVSSAPGAGQRTDEPPAELVLVFSERLDELGTSVDVLDAAGRDVVRAGGAPDPANSRLLIVPLPDLADGFYTVAWRSLSADDGHTRQGFFTFGVGDVVAPGAPGQQPTGDADGGHGVGQAILEPVARWAGEMGSMLAFGLVVVALAVVRPLDQTAARMLANWAGLALVVAAAGAASMIVASASQAGTDPFIYAGHSQPGRLLLARAVLGSVVGAAALVLVSRWPPASLALSAPGGALLVLLLALSGHGSAFDSPVPSLMIAVHVAAAGSWLAGLLVLGWLALAEGGRRRELLRAAVPRFSAVALAAVGLFALTGGYAWWLMNRQIIDLESPYGSMLALKVVVALAALALGGLNYAGWRWEGRLGLHRRVAIEATLGMVVVALTALVASGSPAGPLRPVPIADAPTTAPADLDASLSLLPARPGPNRVHVTLAGQHSHTGTTALELVLQRLDQAGETRVELHPTPADPSTYATDTLFSPQSRWDASVRLTTDGQEQARSRFVFAFDDSGLSEGRALPPLDPPMMVALLLGGLAVLAATFAIAGGAPPRTHRSTARYALVAGAVVAGALAVAALAVGSGL